MRVSGTGDGDKISPQDALIISLLYFSKCCGDPTPEILMQIGAASNRDADAVHRAMRIAKSTDMSLVLMELRALLNDAQKRAIVIRMIEGAVSAGSPNKNQWNFIKTYCGVFEISNDDLDSYLEILTLKNDLSIFEDSSIERNGATVTEE